MEKTKFKWRKCLPTLWKLPKFNPLLKLKKQTGEEEADKPSLTTGSTTNTVSVMGSNLERPIGIKKAKRMNLMEKLDGASTPSMCSLDVNNKVMQSMDVTNWFKAHQQSMAMRANLFVKMGDVKKARAIMEEMEAAEKGDMARAQVPIPEEHKLPAILVASKPLLG